jgi:hypothetical protein
MSGKIPTVGVGLQNKEPANMPNWKLEKPFPVQTTWRHNDPPGFATQKSNVIDFPRATAQ